MELNLKLDWREREIYFGFLKNEILYLEGRGGCGVERFLDGNLEMGVLEIGRDYRLRAVKGKFKEIVKDFGKGMGGWEGKERKGEERTNLGDEGRMEGFWEGIFRLEFGMRIVNIGVLEGREK